MKTQVDYKKPAERMMRGKPVVVVMAFLSLLLCAPVFAGFDLRISTSNDACSQNGFSGTIQIWNTGATAVDMTNLTVRLYFNVTNAKTITTDINSTSIQPWNASGTSLSVNRSTVTMGSPCVNGARSANQYVEIDVASTTPALVESNRYLQVDFAIHYTDWSSPFDSTCDDYTRIPNFALNSSPYVTLYNSGSLVVEETAPGVTDTNRGVPPCSVPTATATPTTVGIFNCAVDSANATDCEFVPVIMSTPTVTPTRTSTPTATPTATATSTRTATPTATATNTATPTFTVTSTPTNTATRTSTPTATDTFTQTPTPTSTSTRTATPTATETFTLTNTISSDTPTFTRTATQTYTATPTYTSTETITVTRTATPTSTETNTRTATPTATETSTATPTVTETSLYTRTVTPTITDTRTATPTLTATQTLTATRTVTDTATETVTITATPTFTDTPTETFTSTATLTATETRTVTFTPSITATPLPWPFIITISAYNEAGELVKIITSELCSTMMTEMSLTIPGNPDSNVVGSGNVVNLTVPGVETWSTVGAGSTTFTWNLTNNQSQEVTPGKYFIKTEVKDEYGHTNVIIKDVLVVRIEEYIELKIYNTAGEVVRLIRDLTSPVPVLADLGPMDDVISFEQGGVPAQIKYGTGASQYLNWDGKNSDGKLVTAGNYELQLLVKKADGTVSKATKTVIVLRDDKKYLDTLEVWPNPYTQDSGVSQVVFNWSLLTAAENGQAYIRIYNKAGELVFTIKTYIQAGTASWNLRTTTGERASRGVYNCVLTAKNDQGYNDLKSVKLAIISFD